MIKLAESSGTVIYENANKLHIVKKPAQLISIFLYVTGLLAFIFLTNGIFQLFFLNKQPDALPNFVIILLALGIIFMLIFFAILSYRRKLNKKPMNELKCICIIDLSSGYLLNENQSILSPLSKIHLERKMQITSSSPELILKWDNQSISIVKGNPFSGGISAVEKVLISKGIQ